ncbi:MAG: Fe-S cluster assembly protein SufD, partial [Maritimibacter harenae]
MALPQKKLDATEARLEGLSLPEGAAWATTAREAALGRVKAMGLPERRDEYWKYTRPDTLVQADVPPAATFDSDEAPMYEGVDRLKIVFVDGKFDEAASDDLSL